MPAIAYYNENNKHAAQWLRNLIEAGHIAYGVVDERDIRDVRPSDLQPFCSCHFFAGVGGWPLAARLAGWPDDRPMWSGSCPCQGESIAGKQLGADDPRHLWPTWFPLIRAMRPTVIVGEQVARAAGTHWLDGVYANLESIGYTTRSVIVPACAVDAPHRRERLWFVADRDGLCGQVDTDTGGCTERIGTRQITRLGRTYNGDVADSDGTRLERRPTVSECRDKRSAWSPSVAIAGADGKARRVKPGVRLLANGVPARVGRLRAYGNAIVPQVAAEIIGAYMDCTPA